MKMTTPMNYRLPKPMQAINIALTAITLLLGCNIANASTLTDGQFQTIINGLNGVVPSGKSDFLYERAAYLDNDEPYEAGVARQLYERLQSEHIASLGTPSYVPIITDDIATIVPVFDDPKAVGDGYTQSHLIRHQVSFLLRRHLIDGDKFAESEATQRITLYQNAFNYAVTKNIQYGSRLGIDVDNSPIDMIWPEKRYIDGQEVVVPVVYLTSGTVNANKVNTHEDQFNGVTQFGSIHLNDVGIKAGRDAFLYAAKSIVVENNGYISGLGNLSVEAGEEIVLKSGVISSNGNLNLRAGGDFQLVSSTIKSQGDLYVGAHNVVAQTLVHRFDYNGGQGTRFGQIASINSATGDVFVQAMNDIAFYGASVSAGGGIKLAADGNIYLGTVQGGSSSSYVDGGWKIDTSSVEYLRTFLSAEETISLIAGGQIVIDAASIVSDEGHIEMLAGLGITIEDEMAEHRTYQKGKFGKKKKEITDYQTVAIRSILDAGKGVRLHTDLGDITLKATEITSAEGAHVSASNGKVNLLLSKELDHYSYVSTYKGTFKIKNRNEGHYIETAIPNAIVGGLKVEAAYGLNVEYVGDPNLSFVEQIGTLSKLEGMQWIAQICNPDANWDEIETVQCNNPDVNWIEAQLAYDTWKESNSSVTPALAALITVVVAVVTGGAGIGLTGLMTTAVGGSTVLGGALAAGITAMASQTTIALASGNIRNLSDMVEFQTNSETMKNVASSMITAGAVASVNNYFDTGNFLDLEKGAETAANFSATGTNIQLVDQAAQAVVNATVKAGVNALVYGGDLGDFQQILAQSLAQDAINQLGAKIANKIGRLADSNPPQIGEALRYVSHAALGCGMGVASAKAGGLDEKPIYSCQSGAGGAVVGEAIAQTYSEFMMTDQQKEVVGWFKSKGIFTEEEFAALSPAEKIEYAKLVATMRVSPNELRDLQAKGVDLAKMGAALIAFSAGANVNIAAQTAENAAENNWFQLVVLAARGAVILYTAIEVYQTTEDAIATYEEYVNEPDPAKQTEILIKLAKQLSVNITVELAAGYTGTKLIKVIADKAKDHGWDQKVLNVLNDFYENRENGKPFEHGNYSNPNTNDIKDRLAHLDSSSVQNKLQKLGSEGHGIQRHGPEVTEQQLIERAVEGKDPMTGTAVDGVHGGEHGYAVHATKVNSVEAYVFAEDAARNSQMFTDAVGAATVPRIEVRIPLKELYGDDFREFVTGISRFGTKKNPEGYGYTRFSDDAYMAVRYQQDSSGNWVFNTMFPQP